VRLLNWFKDRVGHKLDHLRWSNIKKTLREHGLALVVIVVGWEIIEDILFPVLFVFLGNNVHPAFYAGAPASLLLCFHWLAVPLMWGLWIKIKGGDEKIEHDCGGCDESR
jgi:hypothetical protein